MPEIKTDDEPFGAVASQQVVSEVRQKFSIDTEGTKPPKPTRALSSEYPSRKFSGHSEDDSVVRILTRGKQGADGAGSGFFFTCGGSITTPYHVLNGKHNVQVEMLNGKWVFCQNTQARCDRSAGKSPGATV